MKLAQIGEIVAVACPTTCAAAGNACTSSLGAYMRIHCALNHLTALNSCVRATAFLKTHLIYTLRAIGAYHASMLSFILHPIRRHTNLHHTRQTHEHVRCNHGYRRVWVGIYHIFSSSRWSMTVIGRIGILALFARPMWYKRFGTSSRRCLTGALALRRTLRRRRCCRCMPSFVDSNLGPDGQPRPHSTEDVWRLQITRRHLRS